MKRLFSLALTVTAATSLAACGGGDPGTDTTLGDTLTTVPSTGDPGTMSAADAGTLEVALIDAQGSQVGVATFRTVGTGVEISLEAEGLPEGEHGFHIHETGSCVAPDFSSAGGHFNPTDREHGTESAEGPHAGDLPNLTVGADGTATVTVTAADVTLTEGQPTSLLRPGGTALVIHAGADDYRTQPTGDAGARLACGVIQRR